MKSIQSAIDNDCDKYDFMLGDFDSYKKKYGCATEMMFDVEIYNKTVASRVLYLFSLSKSLVKKIINKKPVKT